MNTNRNCVFFFSPSTAESMRALFGKGIVHRDLKPQNILLAHAGKPNPAPHQITLKIGKLNGFVSWVLLKGLSVFVGRGFGLRRVLLLFFHSEGIHGMRVCVTSCFHGHKQRRIIFMDIHCREMVTHVFIYKL